MEQRTLGAIHDFCPNVAEYDGRTVSDLFGLADLVGDIERRIRDLAENSGMPALHFFVLKHLALNCGAASLGELLAALNLPKQSATYVVDRLETDGLVERRQDQNDRRRFELVLTEPGRRVVRQTLGPFYGVLLRAMSAISPDDRLVLMRSLRVFRSVLAESKTAEF